jgi:diguanylate cyclase (GGDEF)-like protein
MCSLKTISIYLLVSDILKRTCFIRYYLSYHIISCLRKSLILFRKIKSIQFFLSLLFFIHSSITFAAAPTIRFEHINIGDGLAINHGRVILQDNTGFLWIGTFDGLVRYDGYDVKVFRNDPTDINSISDSVITSISEDSQNNLWVGTNVGLNLFNPKTEQFIRYRHQTGDINSLSDDAVRSIAEDSQGNIWVGTRDGGLNKFNPETESFKHYRHQANDSNSLSHDFVQDIFEDSRGVIWLATDGGGLNKFNAKTEQFIRYSYQANIPNSLSHDVLLSITEDSQGNLWVGTYGGGLNQFNPQTEQFIHYRHYDSDPNSLSDDNVSIIIGDSQGNIWAGTDDGLNKFNPKTGQFSHYRHESSDPNSLSKGNILSIIEDYDGNLWIGTNVGLNQFHPKTEKFKHYRHQTNDPNSLSNGSVWGIVEDSDSNLWVGTDVGLDKFDAKTKQVSRYRHQPSDPNSLSNDNVSNITEDSKGNIWVATNNGLNKFNPINEQFSHYRHQVNDSRSFSEEYVANIFEDSNGFIWVGTGDGLSQFDPNTNEFSYYRHQASDFNSLSSQVITSIAEDSQGNIWVGTYFNGLSKINPLTERFVNYRHKISNPDSLSHDLILSLFEDSYGNIWIGTSGGGLNLFDKKSETFRHYNKKNGLPSDIVHSIEEDNNGYLWLSTSLGLSRFNPNKETFKNYNVRDGLQSNDFNQGASFKSKKGEMFFGGTNGFNRFFPENIIDNIQPPNVVLTDMFLLNKSVPIIPTDNPKIETILSASLLPTNETGFSLAQSISNTKAITLTHNDNIFAFEFAALGFTNPQKNKYAYQLDGWDKNWVTTDFKHRRATYTNLPDGDYTFKVKASNSDGYWNEEGVSLQITILPPLWKTWWAYTIYSLISALITFAFLRSQQRKVIFERNLNAQLEDKVKERTRKLEEAYTQLEEVSLTDQLTGLKNRRFLQNNIDGDIALVERKYQKSNKGESVDKQPESDLICFLIDLDHFKLVNDVHGHAAGDAVLIQIKFILEQVFRETDYLIRWGGEEFLVVARFTARDNAPELAERLRITVEEHDFDIGENKAINKTCSIGFACYPFSLQNTKALEWSQVIDIADHCLYAAKKSSRNAWVGLNTSESCIDEELFTRTIKKTQTLIESKELQLLSSISDHDKVQW